MSQTFAESENRAADALIELALREDLGEAGDLTCRALIDPQSTAAVSVVSREAGVLAGTPVAQRVFANIDAAVRWQARLNDGDALQPGAVIAEVAGPLHAVLTGERTALNFLTHLSGIATIARRFADAVAGTSARVFDTRKTLPGYRVLEKYAVRVGGGRNHRMGLFDGVLIKDNHLAGLGADSAAALADAVRRARRTADAQTPPVPVGIEVDTLEQLRGALPGAPDYVLLDNMTTDELREAVAIRDATAPGVQLEASGGVTLETVRGIAETGVERISVGALTHSAGYLDVGFDWPWNRESGVRGDFNG